MLITRAPAQPSAKFGLSTAGAAAPDPDQDADTSSRETSAFTVTSPDSTCSEMSVDAQGLDGATFLSAAECSASVVLWLESWASNLEDRLSRAPEEAAAWVLRAASISCSFLSSSVCFSKRASSVLAPPWVPLGLDQPGSCRRAQRHLHAVKHLLDCLPLTPNVIRVQALHCPLQGAQAAQQPRNVCA